MPKATAKVTRRGMFAAAVIAPIGALPLPADNPIFELERRHFALEEAMNRPGQPDDVTDRFGEAQENCDVRMTRCPTDSARAAAAKLRVVAYWYRDPFLRVSGADRVLFEQVLAWIEGQG